MRHLPSAVGGARQHLSFAAADAEQGIDFCVGKHSFLPADQMDTSAPDLQLTTGVYTAGDRDRRCRGRELFQERGIGPVIGRHRAAHRHDPVLARRNV
jgi:hypothetical protein